MKIAVTGYTGFIGQHLVTELVRQGHIVYPIGRDMRKVECDRVYHLACPSSTAAITADPRGIMDIIINTTKQALEICPSALFVNASSFGATELDNTPQGAYNVAKRCMETYIHFSGVRYKNYRLPAVYGEGMDSDKYVKRCVDQTASFPTTPDRVYYIAHISDVVQAMTELVPIVIEQTTLGNIYEQFNSGRRGLHRPTPCRPLTEE